MRIILEQELTGKRDYGRARVMRDNRGVTLIGVLIMVMISSILLAAAVPLWTTVIQRDKEAELIYRGEQYVTAIEAFQIEVGRPPNKIEELVKYKTIDQKKFIRKLYSDPMTEDGEWEIVFAHSGPQRAGRSAGGQRGGAVSPTSGPGMKDDRGSKTGFGKKSGSGSTSGPLASNVRYSMPGRASRQKLGGGFILGVRSKSTDKSIKVYKGKETYSEWEFKARYIQKANSKPGSPRKKGHKSMYEKPRDSRRRRALDRQRRNVRGRAKRPSAPRVNKPR